MHSRELRVQTEYEKHARSLDRRFYAQAVQGGQVGPILTRLRSFGRVRGLVYGAYGEASADVHDLLRTAAHEMAERTWRLLGARSADEMRSFMVASARRRVGLAAVQAMARHRLARETYVGADRAVVEDVMQERMRFRQGRRARGSPEWAHQAQDVYAALARAQGYRGA